MAVDPFYAEIARWFLALLLVSTALHKGRDYVHFKAAMGAYGLLPSATVVMVAPLLLASEIGAGMALLTPSLMTLGAVAATSVFGLYFVAMAVNIVRGRTMVDCGCSFSRREAPLSGWHLLRNAALIGLAGSILLPRTARELGMLDVLQIGAGVAAVGVLYLSMDALLSNRGYLVRGRA